jgi:hypothetical protein
MLNSKIPERTERCLFELDMLRETYGTSAFDDALRILGRRRLDGMRTEKRRRFKWPKDYRPLYDKQKGLCPKCSKEMAFIRGAIEIDHFDPLAEDFNADSNLRVMHAGCNSSKGADSIYETARKSSKTVLQIVAEQRSSNNSEME